MYKTNIFVKMLEIRENSSKELKSSKLIIYIHVKYVNIQ